MYKIVVSLILSLVVFGAPRTVYKPQTTQLTWDDWVSRPRYDEGKLLLVASEVLNTVGNHLDLSFVSAIIEVVPYAPGLRSYQHDCVMSRSAFKYFENLRYKQRDHPILLQMLSTAPGYNTQVPVLCDILSVIGYEQPVIPYNPLYAATIDATVKFYHSNLISRGFAWMKDNFSNVLSLLLFYTYWTLAFLCLIIFAVTLYWISRVAPRHIKQTSQLLPYTPGEVKNYFKRKLALPMPCHANMGHETLAKVRTKLEQTALGFLLSHHNRVRDIGGSATKNSDKGNRIHVCYPNLDCVDAAKLNSKAIKNEIGIHLGQNCDMQHKIPAAMMMYVDFHMKLEDIANSVSGPTILITHCFKQGLEKWYDGEAIVEAVENRVRMATRLGNEYDHFFHQWKDEGVILGNRAINYIRLIDWEHSSVFLLYPTTGCFSEFDPFVLNDPHRASRVLPKGHTYVEMATKTMVYDQTKKLVCELPNAVLTQCAHTAKTMKRDAKYVANLDALIRARFAASKLDTANLKYASIIVANLADQFSLDMNHLQKLLPEDVTNLNWFSRQKYRFVKWLVTEVNPRHMMNAIYTYLLSDRKETSLTPWLWKEYDAPNYETLFEGQEEKHNLASTAGNTNQQPFPKTGTSNRPQPNHANISVPVKHTAKPERKCQPKGGNDKIRTPPTCQGDKHRNGGGPAGGKQVAKVEPKTHVPKEVPNTRVWQWRDFQKGLCTLVQFKSTRYLLRKLRNVQRRSDKGEPEPNTSRRSQGETNNEEIPIEVQPDTTVELRGVGDEVPSQEENGVAGSSRESDLSTVVQILCESANVSETGDIDEGDRS